ncbi:MAG: lipoyl(octanoyl) transferase LipB [Burkholderiales bacterium]|jgi:lipoyl(octanoyl) transferase
MAAVLAPTIRIRQLGNVDYLAALEAMRRFTAQRNDATDDELWLLEHPPVYTLGLGADAAHGPRADHGIPVVQVERGGEVTYHGPGQVVLYTLVDLARRALKVREFVAMLEQSVIDLLDEQGVDAGRRPGAPGVYVGGAKIAALGIRVARGRAFHGLALNVDLDLGPFGEIDPCGYPGLTVTRTSDLGIAGGPGELGGRLAQILAARLGHA